MDELSATFTELLADPVRARSAERLLPPEGRRSALDRLASLAAQLVGAPSAQVSLLATEQTVVAGAGEAFHHVGVRGDLEDSLCSVTAASRAPLVVGATALDERVRMLPPVTSGVVGSYWAFLWSTARAPAWGPCACGDQNRTHGATRTSTR